MTLLHQHFESNNTLISQYIHNDDLQTLTQKIYSSVENSFIDKHFKEHRTKRNLKQNDICVHCHSYKLNVAFKNRFLGEWEGRGESSVEPATDPEPDNSTLKWRAYQCALTQGT